MRLIQQIVLKSGLSSKSPYTIGTYKNAIVKIGETQTFSFRQVEGEKNHFFRPGVFVPVKFARGNPYDRCGADGPFLRSGRNTSFPFKDVKEVRIGIPMGSEPSPGGDTGQHGFGGSVQ